jgi:hypothetical protein
LILVTGASGFGEYIIQATSEQNLFELIGTVASHIIVQLLEQGYRV